MDAAWLIGIIVFIGATIFICWKTGQVALEKYGMRLVMNWTFVLVAAGSAALIASLVTSSDTSSSNSVTYLIAGLAAIAGGGYLNVKRSVIGFGLWFTFVQFITATSIIAAIVYFVARRKAAAGSMGVLR